MSTKHQAGRPKPKFPVVDAPAEGPAVALTIESVEPGAFPTTVSCALLGPGRDHLTREDAVSAARTMSTAGLIRVTVSEEYATISALVAEHPTAKLDPTARRLLAAERARADYAAAVDAWGEELEAAGLRPCERCGGDGGWKGWPGYTCYRCNGSGCEPLSEEVAS
jgi:hypothetical protein